MIKWIEGYEGIYDVTDTGVVRKHSSDGVKEVGFPDRRGYMRVCLTKDKNTIQVKIHKLVAQAFLPNPNDLPAIDHIDGDKLNNRVSNLRWCTIEENLEFYRSSDVYKQLRKFKEVKQVKIREQQERINFLERNLESKAKLLLEVKECLTKELEDIEEIVPGLGEAIRIKHQNYAYYYNKLKSLVGINKPDSVITGKVVRVSGITFNSIHQAAKYIAELEGKKIDTINTEIRKILSGKRSGNTLYKKYVVE